MHSFLSTNNTFINSKPRYAFHPSKYSESTSVEVPLERPVAPEKGLLNIQIGASPSLSSLGPSNVSFGNLSLPRSLPLGLLPTLPSTILCFPFPCGYKRHLLAIYVLCLQSSVHSTTYGAQAYHASCPAEGRLLRNVGCITFLDQTHASGTLKLVITLVSFTRQIDVWS